MPDFYVQYQHKGKLCGFAFPADDLNDAQERLISLSITGIVECEQVAQVEADDATVAWAQVRNESLERIGK